MKLNLSLFVAATVTASPSHDWPPKEGVSVGCGTSFDLNIEELEDVEFQSMLGLTGQCHVIFTAPKGYHLEVACSGLHATANGQDAEDFHGSSPVKIEFNLEKEDSQVFCRVELEEKHKDIKKLHGLNGVDTNIKEFEAAFNIREDDEEKRSAILTTNEETIKHINANRSRTWTAGVTIMSDKTMEEIQALYTGLPPPPSQEEQDRMSDLAERELLGPLRDESRSDALPESVDLTTIGRVSPAKYQGGCGSCAIFAAASTIESCMQKESGILPTDISEQHMIDCYVMEKQGSNICRGAWPVSIHKWIHKYNNGSVANERDYPYAHGGGRFKPGPTQCDPAVRNRNHGAVVTSHRQTWRGTEEDIMRLLAAGHSVTTSFKAKGGFGSYRTGIYQEKTCTNHRDPGKHEGINHAVAIVGYGVENGVKFWKFKNSWGSWWGDNGFGKIIRGGGHCGFAMEFSVPFCSPSAEPVTTPAPSPDGACGGILTERTGIIQSEGFPKAYKNDQNCTWIIQPKEAQLDEVIEFTVESIDIEEDSKSGCSFDYIEFINSKNSPITKLCGKSLPNPILSTDVWTQKSGADCWTKCGKKGGPCSTSCGPDGYCCRKGYSDCPVGAAEASPKKHTCVALGEKKIEWTQKSGADCWYKCGNKGGSCSTFCGPDGYCCRKGYGDCPLGAAKASPKHHTCVEKIGEKIGPSARIQFVTDPAGVDKGFKITYKLLTKKSCKNQKLATNIGVAPARFNSPNYPRYYGNDESCDWTITVPEGYKVNLMFDAFNTELGHDKVTVYDGEGTDSPQLKVFDGSKIPDQVKSSGNKMTVTFTSDGKGTKKGFMAAASATDLNQPKLFWK